MARIRPSSNSGPDFRPPRRDAEPKTPEPKKGVGDLLQENLPLISRLIEESVFIKTQNIQDLISTNLQL